MSRRKILYGAGGILLFEQAARIAFRSADQTTSLQAARRWIRPGACVSTGHNFQQISRYQKNPLNCQNQCPETQSFHGAIIKGSGQCI